MKALVTGANGFVGGYLTADLKEQGYAVTTLDMAGEADYSIDLSDGQAVEEAISKTRPDAVFHLAGMASVGQSWEQPQQAISSNVTATVNLLEAIRKYKKDARVLIIGSSDQYGRVSPEDCPIRESQPVHPVNPYAISKLAQEQFAQLYYKVHNIPVILTRSFNHTGPGQALGFVVPDFSSRIAQAEKAERTVEGAVGNLSAKRDFSDVRDVVRAYRLLIEKGHAGEVYNVGSGQAYPIQWIWDALVEISTADISATVDESKLRPVDLPLIQSDISKLQQHTGYAPKYTMKQTLQDTLAYWREKE